MGNEPTHARTLHDRSAWEDACDAFARADRDAVLDVIDLECWATDAYLAGRDDESTDAWSRAFDGHLAAGDPAGAVMCAFWSAFGLFQRGEMARGGAWVASGHRLVDEHGLDCVGCGYLVALSGLMSLERGAPSEALALFRQALSISRRFDDADLRALGLLGSAQATWAAGDPGAGASGFDEAMLSVTRGRVSAVVAGIVYCAVIDGCQRAFDVGRAREWTAALDRWCESQPQLVSYRGQCLVHRSQVLQLHGDLPAALGDAESAARRLADPPRPAIGMAHYQLGELARMQGDVATAERSYRLAQEHGRSPQPGMALLLVDQGEVNAAAAAIETAVAGARDDVALLECLPAAVEILLAAGQVDRARDAFERLRRLADGADSEFLAAHASHAAGTVLLAAGDARGALAPLRAACDSWRRLETPFHEGRTRLAIALACRTLGDPGTAELEVANARRTFGQIGAAAGLRRVDAEFGPSTEQRAPTDLTPRELQVVRRVSAGRTNGEIAADLFISVKTVERHLSNIFVKLDAPNRAAAVSIAARAGLL